MTPFHIFIAFWCGGMICMLLNALREVRYGFADPSLQVLIDTQPIRAYTIVAIGVFLWPLSLAASWFISRDQEKIKMPPMPPPPRDLFEERDPDIYLRNIRRRSYRTELLGIMTSVVRAGHGPEDTAMISAKLIAAADKAVIDKFGTSDKDEPLP